MPISTPPWITQIKSSSTSSMKSSTSRTSAISCFWCLKQSGLSQNSMSQKKKKKLIMSVVLDADDFIDSVDEEFICSICSNVLSEPRGCRDGHNFCKACIENWLKTNRTCPIDRSRLTKSDLMRVRVIENLVSRT